MANSIIGDAVMEARARIREGDRIGEPLERSKLFPPMVVHMIAIGEESGSLDTMLHKGELDACVSYAYGIKLGRTSTSGTNFILSGPHWIEERENPDVVTLFPDPYKESIRFFKKTGVYPPHHTTVVRESILDEYPWVANSLMVAFEESKRIAIERFRRFMPRSLMALGQYHLRELDDIFGPDPFPYGIKANAKAIDMVQTFSVQQGLTERKQPLDEIFPQEVIYREH